MYTLVTPADRLCSSLTNTSISVNPNNGQGGCSSGHGSSHGGSGKTSHIGIVVGIAVGAVATAVVLISTVWYLCRGQNRRSQRPINRVPEKTSILAPSTLYSSSKPSLRSCGESMPCGVRSIPHSSSVRAQVAPSEPSMAQIDGQVVTACAPTPVLDPDGTTRGVASDAASASLSPTEVGEVRRDVQGLRWTMQQLHAERFEQPPEYSA